MAWVSENHIFKNCKLFFPKLRVFKTKKNKNFQFQKRKLSLARKILKTFFRTQNFSDSKKITNLFFKSINFSFLKNELKKKSKEKSFSFSKKSDLFFSKNGNSRARKKVLKNFPICKSFEFGKNLFLKNPKLKKYVGKEKSLGKTKNDPLKAAPDGRFKIAFSKFLRNHEKNAKNAFSQKYEFRINGAWVKKRKSELLACQVEIK